MTSCLISGITEHPNPNKRKVKPLKVTCVAWISKDSEHGSKGRLIKLKSEAIPMSGSHCATSSSNKETINASNISTPSKQTRSTPQALFNGGFDAMDFGFPHRPMRIPHTKVIFIALHDQETHSPNRHLMTIYENGWITRRASSDHF